MDFGEVPVAQLSAGCRVQLGLQLFYNAEDLFSMCISLPKYGIWIKTGKKKYIFYSPGRKISLHHLFF